MISTSFDQGIQLEALESGDLVRQEGYVPLRGTLVGGWPLHPLHSGWFDTLATVARHSGVGELGEVLFSKKKGA